VYIIEQDRYVMYLLIELMGIKLFLPSCTLFSFVIVTRQHLGNEIDRNNTLIFNFASCSIDYVLSLLLLALETLE
jgi:hypothetical protein